jgi:myo-inositol 2-dehydrogenase/D-chiro-inositol 1-dehydrogenase
VFAARATDGGLKDLQVAVVETEGGAVVTIEVFVNAAYGYDIHTEVVGTAGTVSLTPPYGVSVRRVLPAPPARSGVDGRVVGEDATERFRDAYRVEVGSWIDDVRAGRHTGPTAWDGYRANVAAFAAIRSQRHGARVEIPRDPRPDLYG